MSAPFIPRDKVMAVKGNKGTAEAPNGKPSFGKVYCILDCWMTSLGWQVYLVGFGSVPIINGLKTGWPAKCFRKIEDIRERNRRKLHAHLESRL